MLRVAHSLIFNDQGKVLLLKIGEHKVNPGRSHTFDFPGGIVEAGESLAEGACRELQEETAITLSPKQFHLAYKETKFLRTITESLFIASTGKSQVNLSWEHESHSWVSFEALLDTQLSPFFQRALNHVNDNKLIDRLITR